MTVWVAVLVGLRLFILQPERCGDVGAPEVRAAATAAVNWLIRNQEPDGQWLYRYDAVNDRDLGGYNVARHAGVAFSLYGAAAADIAAALKPADRSSEWLRGRLTPAGGGVVVDDYGATVGIGGSALWVLALGERRLLIEEDLYDEELRGLGAFPGLADRAKRSGCGAVGPCR